MDFTLSGGVVRRCPYQTIRRKRSNKTVEKGRISELAGGVPVSPVNNARIGLQVRRALAIR